MSKKQKIIASVDASDHKTAEVIMHKLAHDHNIHHHHIQQIFTSPLAGWLFGYYDRCRAAGLNNGAAGSGGSFTVGNQPTPAATITGDPAPSADASASGGVSTTAKDKFIAALQNYGK